MSGMALTTVSPSRTSSRRSTPCVEGCCVPNESVIRVSESGSGLRSIEIADCGLRIADCGLPFGNITFLIVDCGLNYNFPDCGLRIAAEKSAIRNPQSIALDR